VNKGDAFSLNGGSLAFVLIVVTVLTVVVVLAIALWSVGFAVGKTRAMPPQIVVDGVEAIEFCAEALPDHVTAELSYDELRRVLRLHLEWIQAYHWAPEGDGTAPVVFEAFDPLPYMIERAEVLDLELPHEHLEAVIEAHNAYLQVMGAIHLEDPVLVEADLAEVPMLEAGTGGGASDDEGGESSRPEVDGTEPRSAGDS